MSSKRLLGFGGRNWKTAEGKNKLSKNKHNLIFWVNPKTKNIIHTYVFRILLIKGGGGSPHPSRYYNNASISRYQYFRRDADELESWIHEKLQVQGNLQGSGDVVSAVCYTIYIYYLYISLCTQTAETTSPVPFFCEFSYIIFKMS